MRGVTTSLQSLSGSQELRLLGLAALLALMATVTTIDLLQHAKGGGGRARRVWLATAAAAGGFALWAAQVVALLADDAAVPLGAVPVVLSLAASVVTLAAALRLALDPRPALRMTGGALLGLGVLAPHDLDLIGGATSLGDLARVGAGAGAAALIGALGMRLAAGEAPGRQSAGSLVLVCAGLARYLGQRNLVHQDLPHQGLAALSDDGIAPVIGVASLMLLAVVLATLAVDRQARRRREQQDLARSLADASIEGIALCDGDRIVTANTSLAALLGCPAERLRGRRLGDLLEGEGQARLDAAEGRAVAVTLVGGRGERVAAEAALRPITVAGRPHRALAVRDVTARLEAERHIQYLVHHDALTGLPNRARFNERLEGAVAEAARGARGLAVLCLDVDCFKEVNDTCGEAAGDAGLRLIVRWVERALAEDQVLARLGADEFAVLAPGLEREHEVSGLAERVLAALRPEIWRESGLPALTLSIGAALFPRDAQDAAGLMSRAEAALAAVKAQGGDGFRIFEVGLGAELRERRGLEHDLRQAARRGEFALVYQPQIDVASGRVVGFEALLRWTHPERGQVPPDRFIPIAEETGSILAIGEWVLRQVCREAAGWESPLRVAVNVSPVQLHHPDFAQVVQEVLHETGLDPARLELEITETALVREPARALVTLRRLKALGLRIAMDDFGTGYSSLSNLRVFPFDKIKIDRSLVRAVDENREAAAILRAVLGLGRGLGLPVVAEGVETLAELAFLDTEACQEAQGYLIGKPLPIEAFGELTRLGPAAQARGARDAA